MKEKKLLSINQPVTHKVKVQIQKHLTTVVQMLNQGILRHPGVSDGGVLFGYFLDKQKVTGKKPDLSKMKRIIITLLLLFSLHTTAQPLKVNQQFPGITFKELFNSPAKELQLSSFKDKMIIFDFWSINCIGCIQSFPKLDSLQKKFSNNIQLFLVSREPLPKVKDFFEKRKKIKIPQVPFICNDSLLQQFFPHEGVPAIAWLNKEHQFRYITNGSDLNEQSIAKLLNNESLKLSAHQTGHQQIKNIINKEYEENLQFVSFLSNCIIGNQETRSKTLRNRTTGIQVKCESATGLYIIAFNEEGKYNYKRVGRLITDFEESYKYIKPANEAEIQGWKKLYAYSYELLIPQSDTLLKYSYMKQDLQRYFQISAEVKPVYKKCIVLETINGTVNIKTKGGVSFTSFDRSSVSGDVTFPQRELINYPFQLFLNSISYWLETEYKLPFENNVTFNGNVDIRLSGETVESLSIKKMNEELKQYGLVLIEKEMPVQCLILSDKKKPVQ